MLSFTLHNDSFLCTCKYTNCNQHNSDLTPPSAFPPPSAPHLVYPTSCTLHHPRSPTYISLRLPCITPSILFTSVSTSLLYNTEYVLLSSVALRMYSRNEKLSGGGCISLMRHPRNIPARRVFCSGDGRYTGVMPPGAGVMPPGASNTGSTAVRESNQIPA